MLTVTIKHRLKKIQIRIKEEKILFGLVYSGYLAAINITALVAWIAEFDFSGETVRPADEFGAAALCALGGAVSIIALTLISRKSALPWYFAVLYVASLVLHITAVSVAFTLSPLGTQALTALCRVI